MRNQRSENAEEMEKILTGPVAGLEAVEHDKGITGIKEGNVEMKETISSFQLL